MTKTKKLGLAAMLVAICTAGVVGVASANNGSDDHDAQRTEMKAKWEARKQEMLAKYDTNKDGKLDASERAVMREDLTVKAFEKMDTNKDGQISLDEFKAARGKLGGMRHARHFHRGFRHGMHRGFRRGEGGKGDAGGNGAE